MKIQAGTFSVFQFSIALAAFVMSSDGACPIYFQTHFGVRCIMENNKGISNFKLEKLGGCNYIDTKRGPTTLQYVDCPFDYKRSVQFPDRTVNTFMATSENPNTILRANIFNFICEVESIILRGANIKELEKDAFACLERIQQLDLSDNHIKVLPEGVFLSMTNLETLNLNRNQLESLGHLPFANLTQLIFLYLSENKVKTIDNVFHLNHQLQYFFIDSNQIDCLQENTFIETIKLKQLEMQNNHLKVIHPKTLEPLTALEDLNLSSNEIASLAGGLFQNNSKLRAINLNSNNLTEIQAEDFQGLFSLRKLDLSSNRIAKISGNSFQFLTSLQFVYLHSNELTSLYSYDTQSGIFLDMNLEALTLDGNKLKNLSFAFNNSSIQKLNISQNIDLEIDNNTFDGLRNLELLVMEKCSLTSIPKDIFKHTPELRQLSLSGNKIRELDPQTFSSINLTHLSLSYNQLEKIDLSLFDGISFLNLSRNNLFKIENEENIKLDDIIELDISLNFFD